MQYYALAIANELIDIGKQSGRKLDPLQLMKLVYIAHGFILALLDKSTEGTKLEKVEAWDYGPVFPSVYHSFKLYGSKTVENKSSWEEFGQTITPQLSDDMEKRICLFTFNRYSKLSGGELVDLLHKPGTPWSMHYVRGKNAEIPDETTKYYYQLLVKTLQEEWGMK